MQFGEHKGKTYAEIMLNHPDYATNLKSRYSKVKSVPKYVSEFLESSGTGAPEPEATVPARTRKSILPVKKEEPCVGGCTHCTSLGTNAQISLYTCLDCGHGSKVKREAKP